MPLSKYFWDDIKTSSSPGQNFDVRLHPNDILHRWFPLLDEFFGYNFFEDKGGSITISTDHGFYEIKFNISTFSSKEIKVKVIGRSTISVEGRHKVKQEKVEEVSEYLFKKFVIPEGYDVTKTKCEISADGTLTIIVPKMNINEHDIVIKYVDTNKSKKKLVSKL